MSKKSELGTALKEAMLAKDTVARNTVRLVLTAIKEAEVLKQAELDDDDVLGILQKQVKIRQESLDEAEKAGRDDLKESALAEIAFLDRFLPKKMSDEELAQIIDRVISDLGAESPADMGKVMKALLPEVKGRADRGKISQLVRDKLQGS